MKILCPHCRQRILLQNVKPGRYAPACRHCGEPFALLVPKEADAAPVLAATPEELDRQIASSQATMAPESQAPNASEAVTLAGPPSPPADTAQDATIPEAPASEAPTLAGPSAPPSVAAASSTESSAVSGRLDGYELQSLIGRGGMGEVYLARQVSLDRHVAVKTLHPRWSRDPLFISRFTREAYAAAQLVHHNVVQIYDVGEDDGTNYFSMEYVRGTALSDRIRRDGAMDPEEAAGYVLQAARGLKFAHDHGMIHRDIKPDNLLLNEEGIVKVADLGLVKTPNESEADTGTGPAPTGVSTDANVTAASATMGTPAYMAPEQARDAATVDHRADIYSLGCTFYALLTGRVVFEGDTAAEVITRHATDAV
ncbi:MAG: protein kinase, partial [Phycisphaerae bacterium]|nr:protein kinase [Phycisphaerae bacterium]